MMAQVLQGSIVEDSMNDYQQCDGPSQALPSASPNTGYRTGTAKLAIDKEYFHDGKDETKAVEEKRYVGETIRKQLTQIPTVGRIVNFVQNGVTYAAMIVKVWTNTCVNLLVFPNGVNPLTPGAVDYQGIAHSVNLVKPVNSEWSWHWPERS
jgi:hypothetical protein